MPKAIKGQSFKKGDFEMINEREMKDAVYARHCDMDVNFDTGIEATQQWGKDPESAAMYEHGKDQLEHFTLQFSSRTTVPYSWDGKLTIDVPDDVVAYLLLDAGHIATSPAYRLAMFRVRNTK